MQYSVIGTRAPFALPAVVSTICLALLAGCGGNEYAPVPGGPASSFNLTELRVGCNHGNADQCEYLGRIYQEGLNGIDRDYSASREWFVKACDGGSVKGCEGLMAYLRNNKSYSGLAEMSLSTLAEQEAFRKTCLLGNPVVCGYLMLTWNNEDVFPPVDEGMLPVLDMVCDTDDSELCAKAAFMVEQYEQNVAAGAASGKCVAGEQSDAPARKVSSRSMWTRACGESDDFYCLWGDGPKALPASLPVDIAAERAHFDEIKFLQAERAYGSDDEGGEDRLNIIPRNWAAAGYGDLASIRRMENGCSHGRGGDCVAAGTILFSDPSIPLDLAGIQALWRKGCSLGSAAGCRLKDILSVTTVTVPDKVQVYRLLSGMCDGDDSEACFLAGIAASGWMPVVATGRADLLKSNACVMGLTNACIDGMFDSSFGDWRAQGGVGDLETGAWPQADADMLAACDSGSADACLWIGWALARQHRANPEARIGGAESYIGKACALGDGAACYKYGVMTEGDGATSGDPVAARKFQARACAAGYGLGCARLAEMLRQGKGGPADDAQARKSFSNACELGNGDACAALSVMLEKGDGGAVDSNGALAMARRASMLSELLECEGLPGLDPWDLNSEFVDNDYYVSSGPEVRNCYMACLRGRGDACYRIAGVWDYQGLDRKTDAAVLTVSSRGCEAGSAESCYLNARRQDDGGPIDEKNPPQFMAAYEKACRMGHSGACAALYEITGAPTDKREAARRDELFKSACLAGVATACGTAGNALLAGKNDDRAAARARSLFGIGCNRGDDASCVGLALIYRDGRVVPRDVRLAADILSDACDGDFGDACFELGNMYDEGLIPGVEDDGGEYWQDGCEKDCAASCVAWARHNRDSFDGSTGDRYHVALDKACDLGDPEGCLESGLIYEHADVSELRDNERARALFERACEGGLGDGCREQGLVILNNEPTPADRAVGMAALRKACDTGDAGACNLHGYYEVAAATGNGVESFRKGCFIDRTWGSGAACFNLAQQQTGAGAAGLDALWDRACTLGAYPGCRMKAAGLVKRDPVRASALMATAGVEESGEFECASYLIPDCLGRAAWHEAIGDKAGRDEILASIESDRQMLCESNVESCRTARLLEE